MPKKKKSEEVVIKEVKQPSLQEKLKMIAEAIKQRQEKLAK